MYYYYYFVFLFYFPDMKLLSRLNLPQNNARSLKRQCWRKSTPMYMLLKLFWGLQSKVLFRYSFTISSLSSKDVRLLRVRTTVGWKKRMHLNSPVILFIFVSFLLDFLQTFVFCSTHVIRDVLFCFCKCWITSYVSDSCLLFVKM